MKENTKFLLEPILNSELILVNNARKLKANPDLLNEEFLDEIHSLQEEYFNLEELNGTGLQKEKRVVRDRLKKISMLTFTYRNTNIFGSMVNMMADKIITRPQFSNYTFKDEMKSLALQHIFKYTWKFDPYKKSEITGQYISAFAYISTIIFNACIATINQFNKDQQKNKAMFLEHQKLVHRDSNSSTYGPDFEEVTRKIQCPNLKEEELLNIIKSTTIDSAIEFWIPETYRISEKEHEFVIKYFYNISIRRIKTCTK